MGPYPRRVNGVGHPLALLMLVAMWRSEAKLFGDEEIPEFIFDSEILREHRLN